VNPRSGTYRRGRSRPRVVFGFTIRRGKIVAIDLLADPERIRGLDLVVLGG
jgi:RNA polymerase sigma-70 factor (ECF subfamily)